MDFETRIGKAKIKSVGPHVKVTYNGETIRLSKKKLRIGFVAAVASIICLIAMCKVADKAFDEIEQQIEIVCVRNQECEDAENLLEAYNLNTKPVEKGVWNNDYSCIEGLSEDDLYGFYHHCGYDETENVLKALGYDSWRTFLVRNGYVDKAGAPSVEVWENYAEAELLEEREASKNDRTY